MHAKLRPEEKTLFHRYEMAEEEFIKIIQKRNLDGVIKDNPKLIKFFRDTLSIAIPCAYKDGEGCERAHLFLQRILYYINRLKLLECMSSKLSLVMS